MCYEYEQILIYIVKNYNVPKRRRGGGTLSSPKFQREKMVTRKHMLRLLWQFGTSHLFINLILQASCNLGF